MSAVASSSDLPPLVRGRANLKRIPPRDELRYTDKWPKDRLDGLRKIGDPLADRVATELHANHGGLTNIYDLLTIVRAKARDETGSEGDIFRQFLASSVGVPLWADKQKILRGQYLYGMYLPFSGLAGLCGALVGGAQFATPAVVTALAGNMSGKPTQRLNETGLLLGTLALPGTLFDPGSPAHDSLTRVRLLHGALRHWLPRSGRLSRHRDLVPPKVYVEGEVPVNQQDLAIALGLVGYLNLRSLRHMNVILSSHDIDCYIQMWRYAGYVLGIADELLPATLEDQEEFMLCAMLHQGVPDWVDDHILKNFIGAFASQVNDQSRGLIPRSAVQTFFEQLSVYLNGKDYTTGLHISDLGSSHWAVLLVRALGFSIGTVVPRMPFGEWVLFNLSTARFRRALQKRGNVTGHHAGSGDEQVVSDEYISKYINIRTQQSKL